MAWKEINYGAITFGSIIKNDKGIYILLFDNTVISLNTEYHQFLAVKKPITSGQLYVWEFDDPVIKTTSVLKLIHDMVSK